MAGGVVVVVAVVAVDLSKRTTTHHDSYEKNLALYSPWIDEWTLVYQL